MVLQLVFGPWNWKNSLGKPGLMWHRYSASRCLLRTHKWIVQCRRIQCFAGNIKAALLKRLELRYWLSCYFAINDVLGQTYDMFAETRCGTYKCMNALHVPRWQLQLLVKGSKPRQSSFQIFTSDSFEFLPALSAEHTASDVLPTLNNNPLFERY